MDKAQLSVKREDQPFYDAYHNTLTVKHVLIRCSDFIAIKK